MSETRQKVKVVLNGQHCIEGASRKLYNAMTQALVTGEIAPERAEKNLGLLAEFLETVDFPALRSRYHDLDGRRQLEVYISREKDGRFVVTWDDKRVVVDRKD